MCYVEHLNKYRPVPPLDYGQRRLQVNLQKEITANILMEHAVNLIGNKKTIYGNNKKTGPNCN